MSRACVIGFSALSADCLILFFNLLFLYFKRTFVLQRCCINGEVHTSRMWFCVVCTLVWPTNLTFAWFHWLLCDTWCKSLNRYHATTPVPYVKLPSACSGFSHKSVVSITHEQNVICSKTLIWRQLFADHVVISRPMKWKEKIHRMIRYIYLTNKEA